MSPGHCGNLKPFSSFPFLSLSTKVVPSGKSVLVGRTTHFFGFFTGKQNVSETMPFGVNSHSAKFQADISNSF